MCPLHNDPHQRRVTVQRWSYPDLQIAVRPSQLPNDGRQIALKVNPQRQEIGNYQDTPDARIGQPGYGLGQIGLRFQEGCLHPVEGARRRRPLLR